MIGEKIKFKGVCDSGVHFEIVGGAISGPKSWNPNEEDRQCMIDELVDLLTRMEIVVIPLNNAEVMFNNDQELIDFVRKYNFTVQFNCFQKSFVCTLENKIGG